MEKLNTATRNTATASERKRIPMSVPVQKLDTREIPGYHLHWFNSGVVGRIERAQAGGYEFVLPEEMSLSNAILGGDSAISGNTDMGSHVSILSGKQLDSNGQPARMILMKIKQEWYEEDQKLVEKKNDQVANALSGGLAGAGEAADKNELNLRYVGKTTTLPDLFKKGAMAKKNHAR